MYKRRGRILFLDPGNGSRARIAQAWAGALGSNWIEAEAAALAPGWSDPSTRSVMAEAGVAVETAPCLSWEEARNGAWDLVVPLDPGAGVDWPGLLRGVRAKHWDLAGVCPAGAPGSELDLLRACRDALRDRVEGLLGGFRMKAREDDKAGTMPNDGESD